MVAHASNPRYSGGWGTRIPWMWEVEPVVSWDWSTALQPGHQSKTQSQTNKKTKTHKTKHKKPADAGGSFEPSSLQFEAAVSCHQTTALQLGGRVRSCLSKQKTKNKKRRAWWLMPIIPVLWEAKASGSLEVRSLRPAWPTWWNPVSTKNTKLARCSGACL